MKPAIFRKIILSIPLILLITANVYAQTPNWMWAKNAVCTGSWDGAAAVEVGSNGDIFATGRYGTNMTMAPLPAISGLGGTPIFVTRMTSAGTPVWLTSVFSTGGNDYAYGMNIDNADNTYVAICANSGSGGSKVVKVSPTGTVLWTASATGSGSGAYGVAADASGNMYMTGSINGTLNFNSSASATTITLTSTLGGNDIFLAKYNSAGVVQWVRRFGGPRSDESRSLVCDPAGNVYMSGSYEGTASFGSVTPAAAATGTANLFVAKFDGAGNTQWVTTAANAGIFSGRGFSFWRFNALNIDDCGNLYVTGDFLNTANFGGITITSSGRADMYVAKLNSSGVWQWAKRGGGSGDDMGLNVVVDDKYSVYVTGVFAGTATFDSRTITSTASSKLFVAKYSSTGCASCPDVQIQWLKSSTGSATDGSQGVAVDRFHRVYIAGGFTGTSVFGSTSVTSAGTGDILIASLDTVPLLSIKPTLPVNLCAGKTYTLPYSVTGIFNSSNVFTVQLSNSTGSFASPVIIGTISSAGSGSITITIPPGTPVGSGYRIRIVSSNPYFMGTDNCFDINISDSPVLALTQQFTCLGMNVFSGLPQTGYSYIWNTGATTNNISYVPGGVYSVTATSTAGCTADASLSVVSVPQLTLTSTATHVSCNGGNNGTVNVIASGGTPAYTYTWNTLSNTSLSSGLAAGLYSCTVTDANGCTETTTQIVNEPALPLSATTYTVAVNCNGTNSGSAQVLVTTGGTPAYAYNWSNGMTTTAIGSLAAGAYSLLVTDANGCTHQSSINITQPGALSASLNPSLILCGGTATGSVALAASGGVPSYNYLWNNSQTTANISNIVSGTYNCVVTDANGCSIQVSATVNQLTAMTTIVSSVTNVSCFGGNNGSAAVTVSGGTAAYSYNWNSDSTTAAVNGAAGAYSVVITDANGCTTTENVTITEPTQLIANATPTPSSCAASNNGTIIVSASGGIGAYSYSWSGGQTTQSISNLAVGVYNCVVTDANGCTSTVSSTITQPVVITSTVTAITNVLCNGASTGSANIAVSGGTPAYSYSWNNGYAANNPGSLSAGIYTCIITDNNGCTGTTTVTITEPTKLVANVNSSISICSGQSAVLSVTGSGGAGSYGYSWTTGQSGSSVLVSPLAQTVYTVTVTDANGCTSNENITVSVNSLPNFFFSADKLNGCGPLCVTFNNSTLNSQNITWDFGNGNSSSNNNTLQCFTSPGSYNVTLTVTDNNGCSNTATKNNYITVYPSPTARFTVSSQKATLVLSTINCFDKSIGANAWSWNFGDVVSSTSNEQNPEFTYSDTGSYAITLTVTNEFGCTDDTSITITIEPDYTVFVPNSFTPNGDGRNDVFGPATVGITSENFEMFIFDRWGNLIFQSNDINKAWDGTANGGNTLAQIDTYIYKLRVKEISGTSKSFVGHVNLLR